MTRLRRSQIVLALGAMAGLATVAILFTRSEEHSLKDIDGVRYGSLERPAQGQWSVLFFLTPDCPIANQYAPEIRRICDTYEGSGARCFLVYADPSLSQEAVRKHARDYHGSRFPAILDADYRLVDAASATVSSEVAVFSSHGKLEYRGRIDNFHADLGVPRQQATRHDLRDTLDALIAGRNVPNPRTETVGCFLPTRISGGPL
ncbi:MAG TPA: redoxin domain-containing protein [Terriglobia bacterium]|nr:redoxin domain-containing protein [Terriglobia bacterium]